jgi:chlorobactene glucosyltransferase
MQLALIVLGIISLGELCIWLGPLWRWRKALAIALIIALSLNTGFLLADYLSACAVLLAICNLYRLINLLRLVEGRMQADYLYHATRQTTVWLIGLQLLVYGVDRLTELYHVNSLSYFYSLAILQLLVGLVILASTLRHLKTTRPPADLKGYADRDLPSLTVAIPARNETEDLEACLRSLIASTYPKLEILVLDDCSQNKRTPEIIRDFAHDGVRFIAGAEPPEQWLAKNYVYEQLALEANGELLLFCGVDTRFEPGSLTAIVKTMLQKRKTMVSLVPRNQLGNPWAIAAYVLQPSRYAWELALPRRLLRRPPVLSTCWLITREALRAAGGFAAVSRKGVPESYLARFAAARNDGYSFLQADGELAVTSVKTFSAQRDTAIRTRYLQLHKRPELVALVGLAEFTVLVWPLIIAIVAAVTANWALALTAALAYLTQALVYLVTVRLTYRRLLLPSLWLLPVAALHDIGLLNYSMWQYEFNEVLWKGRNVCIPLMRTIPELPKID